MKKTADTDLSAEGTNHVFELSCIPHTFHLDCLSLCFIWTHHPFGLGWQCLNHDSQSGPKRYTLCKNVTI